jgi:DNA-binding transcriptional LysR family regulator
MLRRTAPKANVNTAEGLGIGTSMENNLAVPVNKGRIVQVLQDWCPAFLGYFLSYPSRRNQPAALAALIQSLRS